MHKILHTIIHVLDGFEYIHLADLKFNHIDLPDRWWNSRGSDTAAKMKALRLVGVPYTDADIEGAAGAVAGATEAEALIAYLQNLGIDMREYGAVR